MLNITYILGFFYIFTKHCFYFFIRNFTLYCALYCFGLVDYINDFIYVIEFFLQNRP